MKGEIRQYPSECTSAFCGEISCPRDCPNLPKLTAWKKWREETDAFQEDPIWSPTFWTAKSDTQEGAERETR
jgi:hypothetical protein